MTVLCVPTLNPCYPQYKTAKMAERAVEKAVAKHGGDWERFNYLVYKDHDTDKFMPVLFGGTPKAVSEAIKYFTVV